MKSNGFWKGILSGIVLTVAAVLFLLPMLGLFNTTAMGEPGILDWWGSTNWQNSLKRHAPDNAVPATADAQRGFEHYKESCVQCHGAPSVDPAEWAQFMQPMPPDLWMRDSQQLTDGELYRIVSKGVRMTGMPAFSPEHDDAAIWDIVAFVRNLNELTPQQKESLEAAVGSQHHQGEQGEQQGNHMAMPQVEGHHPMHGGTG